MVQGEWKYFTFLVDYTEKLFRERNFKFFFILFLRFVGSGNSLINEFIHKMNFLDLCNRKLILSQHIF